MTKKAMQILQLPGGSQLTFHNEIYNFSLFLGFLYFTFNFVVALGIIITVVVVIIIARTGSLILLFKRSTRMHKLTLLKFWK